MSESQSSAVVSPAEKVKSFPTTPGIYLMKDAQGRVIYVGKAKNLRARAGSYFHKAAAEDRRICAWIDEVADVDHLPTDSEVDALLMEARLIKDIQPK
jgi:excinuclease ABC subunit C